MYTDIVNSKDYESMTKSVEIARAEAYKDYNASIAEDKLLIWKGPVSNYHFQNEDDWRKEMNIFAREKLEYDLSKIEHSKAYNDYLRATTAEEKSIKRVLFFKSEWGEREVYVMFSDFMESEKVGSFKYIWDSHTKAERYIWEEVYIQMYKIRLSHP